MIPDDANYYIIKNNNWGKWESKGIEPGDKVYFKQTDPLTIPDTDPFKAYKSPQEAIASKDPLPSQYEAFLGKLFMWNPKEQVWERRDDPTIECMGWFAVNFKIYDISRVKTA